MSLYIIDASNINPEIAELTINENISNITKHDKSADIKIITDNIRTQHTPAQTIITTGKNANCDIVDKLVRLSKNNGYLYLLDGDVVYPECFFKIQREMQNLIKISLQIIEVDNNGVGDVTEKIIKLTKENNDKIKSFSVSTKYINNPAIKICELNIIKKRGRRKELNSLSISDDLKSKLIDFYTKKCPR